MRNIMELNLDSGANLFAMPELGSKHPAQPGLCLCPWQGEAAAEAGSPSEAGLELLGCEARTEAQ